MAKRLRVSRSHLYAQALTEFLAERDRKTVTAKLDELYSEIRAEVDPGLKAAQMKILKETSW